MASTPGVPAGQGGAVFAEATFDIASGRWSWSPEMYSLIGVRDVGGDPSVLVFERMHPSDRPVVAQVLEQAVRDPGPFAGQYRLRDDEGRERTIAFVGDVLRDAAGEPTALRGVAFDVSRASRQVSAEAVAAATADRAAIEQVKGAVMFAYGLDPDAAFGLLSRYSQRGNVKLATIASRVTGLLATQTEPGTERSLLQVLEQALRPPRRAEQADDGEAETG
ncbi:PAS and ANTAR domain-containing protein [Arthrobacter sp. NEB 688]|uniref:PAS and ANTAR domain-containing protein n=1 Tax=Arthrobacter sp. NEB 688 TaxID=904039 RepID=UPI001565ACAB|nr:PAS and ANTAR domain-containing protein [Arthrobacter sp. NEB 688]QKE85011.1 ANTAR domain-containing protein [Arthrobacter sp. NEB 688]